jgi:hypothetical protein
MQTTLTPNDVELVSTNTPTTHQDFIHNFSDLNWDHENEPNPTTPTQLFHLLTITGMLLIGTYPETHTLGEHYIAWAPLSTTELILH